MSGFKVLVLENKQEIRVHKGFTVQPQSYHRLIGLFEIPQQRHSQVYYDFEKGGTHKYKMRVLTKNPPPKYRYYYDVPSKGVSHQELLKVGSRFAHGSGEDKGHFEVTHVHDDGNVTIKHTTTGDSQKLSHDALRNLLHSEQSEIGQGVREKAEKLLQNYKNALKYGTDYHKEARRKDVVDFAQRMGNESLLNQVQKLDEEQSKIKEVPFEIPKTGNDDLDSLEKKARSEGLSEYDITRIARLRKKPLSPQISVALAPSKKESYHVRHRVIDLFDLITSHNPEGGALNPKYDQKLQSRHRGRLADAQQIAQMAASIEPMALLYDSRRTDEGAPIIGEDMMVESGNGRTMALMLAAKHNNKAWQLYQEELPDALSLVGLSDKDLKGKKFPVIIRERITGNGDSGVRNDFAEKANTSSIKRMSAFEEALRDAKFITPDMLVDLSVGEDEGIEQALSRSANKIVTGRYLKTMPDNESAALVDENGNLSKHGRERFKAALYLYALPGKSGETIAKTFVETSDHDLKNFDTALSKALPRLAKLRAMYDSGERNKNLDIMPDFARSIEKLDQLRQSDQTLSDYLKTPDFFETQTTPLQNSMMTKINEVKKAPKKLKTLINSYLETIESMPHAGQGGLFGGPSIKNAQEAWDATLKTYENKLAKEEKPIKKEKPQTGFSF